MPPDELGNLVERRWLFTDTGRDRRSACALEFSGFVAIQDIGMIAGKLPKNSLRIVTSLLS
ncbi:MAG: hypothetical protein WBX25_04220 [Rhodomicrobium sp.]